jgi:hypothetical protein
LKFQ